MAPANKASSSDIPPTLPHSIDLSDLPDQSPHYLQAVADLGDERDIVAHEDIYAANGMKLLAKGAHINRKQVEQLKIHKLALPLDLVLSTENSLDVGLLVADVNHMFAEDPVMVGLAERSGDPRGFRQGLGSLPLSRPLAFRLTVMREKRNGLYRHTLRVALITHAMSVRLKLSERDKQDVLLAALCHDLGEMHTDPKMLDSGHRITPEERRFIHVHPITSYIILNAIEDIPPATLQAVLHHHERLDGSGYPYGLNGNRIHPLAKLLCVAEVMVGVIRNADRQRLDVMLRLNQKRFDPEVVTVLRDLLRNGVGEQEVSSPKNDASTQLARLTGVLSTWPGVQDSLAKQESFTPQLQFLNERMMMLRSSVLQSGINPADVEVLLELAGEDDQVLTELRATLDELDWLMIDIANEVERRTATLDPLTRSTVAELISFLRAD